MMTLNLPALDCKLQERDGDVYIRDIIRRKYVRLTPEEWVRQHFVHYLIKDLGYPALLMVNEAEIQVGSVRKRCDTIVYDSSPKPIALIEYKAPSVSLSQRTVEQIVRYNYSCRVPFLIMSNGMGHLCCHIDYADGRTTFWDHIPLYTQLCQTDD